MARRINRNLETLADHTIKVAFSTPVFAFDYVTGTAMPSTRITTPSLETKHDGEGRERGESFSLIRTTLK